MRARGKQKLVLYEEELNAEEIIDYLPERLNNKLSGSDRDAIVKAFYQIIMQCEKRYEERYLGRMLI